VLGIAEYDSRGWVPYASRSLEIGCQEPILWPGQGFAKKSSLVSMIKIAVAVRSFSMDSLIFMIALSGKDSRIALMD
jgi:hypothetical protein